MEGFYFPNLLHEYDSTLCIFPFIVSLVWAFRQLPLFVWVFPTSKKN